MLAHRRHTALVLQRVHAGRRRPDAHGVLHPVVGGRFNRGADRRSARVPRRARVGREIRRHLSWTSLVPCPSFPVVSGGIHRRIVDKKTLPHAVGATAAGALAPARWAWARSVREARRHRAGRAREQGEVTPLELVDAAIRRVEALNQSSTLSSPPASSARRQAGEGQAARGPFRGVPYASRHLELRGHALHDGLTAVREQIFDRQRRVVQSALNAGLIRSPRPTRRVRLAATTESAAAPVRRTTPGTSSAARALSGGAARRSPRDTAVCPGQRRRGSIAIRVVLRRVRLKPSRGRIYDTRNASPTGTSPSHSPQPIGS